MKGVDSGELEPPTGSADKGVAPPRPSRRGTTAASPVAGERPRGTQLCRALISSWSQARAKAQCRLAVCSEMSKALAASATVMPMK